MHHSGRIIALGVNAPVVSVLIIARPYDHKVAVGGHGDAGPELLLGDVCVDLKLAALCNTARIVALGVDSPIVAVLVLARPNNDEVAGIVHGHRRMQLIFHDSGIDAEFATLCRAGGVVSLRVNPPAVTVLIFARPDHNKIAVRIRGNCSGPTELEVVAP